MVRGSAFQAAIAASEEAWFIYAAALFLLAGFAGFLPFNLHPARIFMGDVGSQFCGFVLAVHIYQMAHRAGMGVRAVAAVHWGFALFHAGLAALFLQLASWAKPLVVLPALLVQLVWLAFVARRVRRAGLGWRG